MCLAHENMKMKTENMILENIRKLYLLKQGNLTDIFEVVASSLCQSTLLHIFCLFLTY